MLESLSFKICPMCTREWKTRDEFIADPMLVINGYQADFEKLEYGLFYFTHKKEKCFSTMVIEANEFLNIYTGKKYSERRTGKEDCPGYCLKQDQLDRCDAYCECAFNREVIQVIKESKKL